MPRKVHVDELLLPINTSVRAPMAKSNKKKDGRFFLALKSPLCIDFYYKMMMLLPNLVG